MNLNFHSRNSSYLTLRSLPDVVMSHIAQFLSPSDLGNMRRVNQYFCQLFSSPHFWQGIKISMPRISAKHGQLKIDLKVLETIKLRGIKELDLCRLYHNFDNDIRVILALLPQLEGLSIAATTAPKFRALCQAASSGSLNIKKLALLNGPLRVEMQQRYTVQQSMFTDLFMQLPRLEEVRIGDENDKSDYNWYTLQMGSDLEKAFCCSGKLTSVSLTQFSIIEKSCLNVIMATNPHLKSLSLTNICQLVVKDKPENVKYIFEQLLRKIKKIEGHAKNTSRATGDVIDPTVGSRLTSLDVRKCSEEVTESLLSWVFSSAEPNRNLTSLNVSFCPSAVVLPVLSRLPELRKLNLSYCHIPGNCSLQSFHNLQNLEWLELRGNRTRGEQLLELSKLVGKNLHYLGLASTLVTDNDLRNLAEMFPVLKTLDLSECVQVTDAILIEWYNKHKDKIWPKLRKLVLKGCLHIRRRVVDCVRLKTRNQLVVDW